ncbi:MAG: PEP-utilizing enzyme [Candidatus Shapirobacteria bacterium]
MRPGLLPAVQQKIVEIFLQDPKEKFVNELIRLTGEYPNAIQFSLKSLEKKGILKSRKIGRRRFYRLNGKGRNVVILKTLSTRVPHCFSRPRRWVKLLNRDASLAFQAEVPVVNRDVLPKAINYQINNFWFNGITHGVYYREDELAGLARAIQKKLKTEPNFARKNVEQCYVLGKKLLAASKKKKSSLVKITNKQLLRQLDQYREAYLNFLPYLVYPHSVERYFLAEIRNELGKISGNSTDQGQMEVNFQLLTTPVAHEVEQQKDMIKVALRLIKEGWTVETRRQLTKLHQKYCWQTMWTLEAEPLPKEYFKHAIEAIAETKNKKTLQEGLSKLDFEQVRRKRVLEKTLNKVGSPKSLRDLVSILQDYMYLRTYRKNVISKAHYQHKSLIFEIGKRMDLGKDILLVCYEEMRSYLRENKGVSKILLAKRRNGWGVIAWEGEIRVVSGMKEVLSIMEQFQIGNVPIPPASKQKIIGRPACQGKAQGKVRIIHHIRELARIEKGDVLVTKMTTPDFVPILSKVAAIITDEGGVTCHAAIVSRELNIPCIIGTREATQVLIDGALVEVNATDGVVTVLKSVELNERRNVLIGKKLYPGKVKGSVVVVEKDNDLKKVDSRSVIVANSITPRFLSALYKVKGMILEEYTPTSHGYLYARSLKIPSIGGISNATEILRNKDKVELDASKGELRLL